LVTSLPRRAGANGLNGRPPDNELGKLRGALTTAIGPGQAGLLPPIRPTELHQPRTRSRRDPRSTAPSGW
jgi:hypothetical protein